MSAFRLEQAFCYRAKKVTNFFGTPKDAIDVLSKVKTEKINVRTYVDSIEAYSPLVETRRGKCIFVLLFFCLCVIIVIVIIYLFIYLFIHLFIIFSPSSTVLALLGMLLVSGRLCEAAAALLRTPVGCGLDTLSLSFFLSFFLSLSLSLSLSFFLSFSLSLSLSFFLSFFLSLSLSFFLSLSLSLSFFLSLFHSVCLIRSVMFLLAFWFVCFLVCLSIGYHCVVKIHY